MPGAEGAELCRLDQELVRRIAVYEYREIGQRQPRVHDALDEHVRQRVGGILTVGLQPAHRDGGGGAAEIELDQVAVDQLLGLFARHSALGVIPRRINWPMYGIPEGAIVVLTMMSYTLSWRK